MLRLENGWSCNPQWHRTTWVLDRVPRSGRSAPTPRMDGTVASRHRMDFEQSRCFPHAKRLRPTCRKLHTWEAADAPRDSQVRHLHHVQYLSVRIWITSLMVEAAIFISLLIQKARINKILTLPTSCLGLPAALRLSYVYQR